MKIIRRLIVGLWISAALCIMSCSDDSSGVGPGNQDGETWETGAAATYAMNDTTMVYDDIATGVFAVEPGTSGELSVIPVDDGPEAPFSARMFQVEYDGGGTVTLIVPEADDERVVAFQYGELQGAAIDDMEGNVGWWGMVPVEEIDGGVTFELNAAVAGSAKPAAYSPPSSSTFAVARLPKGSSDDQKMTAVRTSINECIETWLTTLPASVSASARTRVEALPWVVSWTNSGNAYQHGNSLIYSNAKFYFSVDANLATIAHEVGHYMTHALLGYDRYNEIYNRFPTDFWGSAVAHDVGMFRAGRLEILEDYAYVSTIMFEGNVSNYDLTSVSKINHVRHMNDSVLPSTRDYPSHEGYGAVVLSSLLRTESEIYTFTSQKGQETATVPVVGAPMGDILGILERGPRDVNELRGFVEEYLASRGAEDQFKLPAMLEPIGWSYHGDGTLKDEDGQPMSSIRVQNIYQDGTAEYALPSAVTDKDGKFQFDRIFPGQSLLRVFYNGGVDSTDFAVTVPWETTTDTAVKLGEFKMQHEDKVLPVSLSGYYVLTPGIRAQNVLTVECSGTLRVSPEIYPLIYNDSNELEVQSSAGLNQNLRMTLDVTYNLSKGTSWNTSLSLGDKEDATSVITELSDARMRIVEAYGPYDEEYEEERSVPIGTLDLNARPAEENGEYYRGDVRLEWDYTQTYYNKDGGIVATESGVTGVSIVHIWRDVSFWSWKAR